MTEPAPLRLSFSKVDTYRTCPLQYRFRSIDKLPQQPSPHLSWGSTIHAAIETWWDQKLPEPPPVDVLLQAYYDNWDDTGFAGMDRDEKLRWYRHGQDVLRQHHRIYAPTFRLPVTTEQWFEVDVGEAITVVGSIDQVARDTDGLGVIDWKTNRKAKPRRWIAGSLQLAIYAYACRELFGEYPRWVALDFVVPGVRVTVPREDIDVPGAIEAIREVAAGIRAEQFPASPSRLCDWCDYRAECPAWDGPGPDVPGQAVVELQQIRRRQERDTTRAAELEAIIDGAGVPLVTAIR